MTQQDIRDRIDANNKLIEALINPTQFVLNSAVVDLMKENLQLQEQCQHEFVNGFCRYCDKKEA